MGRKRKDNYSEIQDLYTLACHSSVAITADSWYHFELKYFLLNALEWVQEGLS